MDYSRLSMPIGEAMFTQRSIRRLRPDPIPMEDLRLIVEAAVKAPNGGNSQPARFLLVTDRNLIREFGALYKEAWWAKRRDQGWTSFEDLPKDGSSYRSAAQLAEDIKDAPAIVFAFGVGPGGGALSVVPGTQNLMLAARSLGIGSCPTTLHAECLKKRLEVVEEIASHTFQQNSQSSFHFETNSLSKAPPDSLIDQKPICFFLKG